MVEEIDTSTNVAVGRKSRVLAAAVLLLLLLKFYLESQTKRAGLPNIMMAIL